MARATLFPLPLVVFLLSLGFAASRNKKSEEERRPSGREEAEKRLSHLKKPRESKENADEGLLLILKSSQNGKACVKKRAILSDNVNLVQAQNCQVDLTHARNKHKRKG